MLEKEIIEGKLIAKGYKLTRQRIVLLEVLLESTGQFLSAQDIFLKVKEKYPKMNFSTIYRNLELLENIDIIHKTNLANDVSFYELISQENHHHHIICKRCGKTEIIDFCPLKEIQSKINNQSFSLTDHKFELYGYCNKCVKYKK